MTGEPAASGSDEGSELDVPKARAADFDAQEFDAQELDDWGEPLPRRGSTKDSEEIARQAWGSWRQDRELNRRKTLRALLWLVVVSVLAGVVAYGCDALRGPRQIGLVERVGDFTLQPPTSETEQLRGRLESAGAEGPVAGRYVGPGGDVLIVAGYGAKLPLEVLGTLLPEVTGIDIEYEGRGGPLTCGPTPGGSRCIWKGGEIVAGTSAAMPPEELERITRELRASAVRP